MELRRSQCISNARSSGPILRRYIEEENAGESRSIVVDEVIENKDNNEPPMVQVPQQPLPIDNYREKDYKSEMLNETAEASSDFILPLLRFQKEWLAWALNQEQIYRGGVLADEMGMGRTIEAIALVLAKRELQQNGFVFSQSPLPSSSEALPLIEGTLVICPVVAITQWVNEIDRCTLKGSTKVLVYHGADRIKNWEQFSKYDFVITSYSIVESECRNMSNWRDRNCEGPGFVRQAKHSKQVKKNKSNAMPALHAVKWQRIVLDEARYIKDKRSKTTQAVFALESTYKWALSGTPFQNRPRELYTLIRFLQINPYSYYFCKHCNCRVLQHRYELCSDCSHDFRDHFNWWKKYIAKPIESSRSNDICGKKTMILLTHTILKNLVLRRTKIGRAADLALPPRIVSVRRDFLDREELDYYETLYKEFQAKYNRYVRENTMGDHRFEIVGLITRLRQVTNHRYLVEFSQKEELNAEDLASSAADKQESGICHKPEEDPVDLTSNKDVRDDDDKIMVKYFRSSRILKNIELENFQTSTKLEALREEIRFMIERDGSAKGIVFSGFSLFVDLIYYSLYKSGVSCVRLNENMSQDARDAVVHRFNVEPDCRIFVMTFMAGGIALNLTVASHVFIMDPSWNPALELQALDRIHGIHGIGQYKPTRFWFLLFSILKLKK
ncbi:ATP-dependent helicase rhp16 isoform X2 [Lathyrus oleraceus]|uniref:Uncharacterized protein n=2 Tax=Pisum sativum TaxID=3888 RepID=A0A9D5AKW6_PEA|nr:ATP-dependent helicase rhp16-like isoform X2 [Pisum sativum]KAI5412643.1 hypothetical protein KIW84_057335 [Pisum sativum]